MKISTAALSFLILAAALGSLAREPQPLGVQTSESTDVRHEINFILAGAGIHRAADCCTSFTTQKIRCVFMKDYLESRCYPPAIIFTTKTEQKVCVNPRDRTAQRCLRILDNKKNQRWQPHTFYPRTSSPRRSLA